MMNLRPFHLAIPVNSIELAREFYGLKLGFKEGRSDEHWIDYNFFGHQLVCHIGESNSFSNEVDGKDVPIPHFGIVLEWKQFDIFSEKLKSSGINFIIEPYLRFEGQPGEQKTLFFKDPFGNALEFKSFKHDSQIFNKSLT
ncbi:VOC family protein [Gammaproteobacteria bacterium]|nr:VOC family protein [Gammaproteobacteria bacterium]